MSVRRRLSHLGIPLAAVAVAFAVGTPVAYAHVHPTPADLVGPAVVYIQSGYEVQVTIVEHDSTNGSVTFLPHRQEIVQSTGSGFVVNQAGVIVTSAGAVEVSEKAAMTQAIDEVFKETYGPTSRFDASTAVRLKACHQGRSNTVGGCILSAAPLYRVFPYVTSQKKYGNLDAMLLPTKSPDVALLRVNAQNMPTVKLQAPIPSTYALGAVGFFAKPPAAPLRDYKAHLDQATGTRFKADIGDNKVIDKITSKVLSGGLQGGPVVAENGQVIGMIAAAGTGRKLVPYVEITAALDAAGVIARQEPADVAYADAEHDFKNKGYAASIPNFVDALNAYPGNYLARTHLDFARKHQSGSSTTTSSSPTSTATTPASGASTASRAGPKHATAWWVWLAAGVAVLLAAGTALGLVVRRRGGHGAGGDRPSRPAAPVGGAPVRAAPPRRDGPSDPAKATVGVTAASGSAVPARPPSRAVRGADGIEAAAHVPGHGPRASGRPSAQSSPSFCTNCGGRLRPHHRFCGWCGDEVAGGRGTYE